MPDARDRLADLPPPEFVKPGSALIAYYSFGPKSGPPLLICHGLAASALQFAEDAEFFAGQGYRVIVPDVRGHGASAIPPHPTASHFTLEAMALDLIAMIEACNVRRIDWVGNSMGGLLGLVAADLSPGLVRSLATFGTSFTMNASRHLAGLAPIGYRLVGRGVSAAITAWTTTPSRRGRALIRRIMGQFDPVVLPALLENLRHYDLLAEAARFSGPMLMVRGGRDHGVNRVLGPTLKLMSGRSNFTLVELPAAGHCANLDTPDALRAAILEHLQTVQSAAMGAASGETSISA